MRTKLLVGVAALFGLALVASACVAETSGQQLAESAGLGLVGSQAPRLVLGTVDGDTIDLGALYGKKAVYLKLWATWCVPCREQMPHFQHVYETAGADLAVIAINIGFNDSVEEVQAYRSKVGITMPVVFDADGHIGAALKLRVTPQHIVIGRDGRIQYVGHLADQRLDAALVSARTADTVTAETGAKAASTATGVRAVKVGDVLPAQSVDLLNGRPFALSDPRGREPTVLVFLSPWCESYLSTTRPIVAANCRAARRQITAHATAHGVRWLGVASGLWITLEDLQKYRSEYHVTIPLTLDASSALFRTFGVNDVPTFVVLDATGRVSERIESGNRHGLEKALRGLRSRAAKQTAAIRPAFANSAERKAAG